MLFIINDNFDKQLKKLSKKFRLINSDFKEFKDNFNVSDWKHLWKWIYKFRIKNSSIPVWKSGWFRVIILSKTKKVSINILKNQGSV